MQATFMRLVGALTMYMYSSERNSTFIGNLGFLFCLSRLSAQCKLHVVPTDPTSKSSTDDSKSGDVVVTALVVLLTLIQYHS